MAKTTSITIRLEPELKHKVEDLYKRQGLSISNAVSMFLHQSLLVDGLPFAVTNPEKKKNEMER